MQLKYKNDSIMITCTTNLKILSYKFQKLYYAIIIDNCNKYSSILNKQRIDVIMVDNDFRVLSIKRGMHENTIYEDKMATKTLLLPLGTFNDLKVGDILIIENI